MIDLGTCIKIQFKILNFLCNKFTIQPFQCITNVASHLSIPAIATFKKKILSKTSYSAKQYFRVEKSYFSCSTRMLPQHSIMIWGFELSFNYSKCRVCSKFA